jgi:hypothetical protein
MLEISRFGAENEGDFAAFVRDQYPLSENGSLIQTDGIASELDV